MDANELECRVRAALAAVQALGVEIRDLKDFSVELERDTHLPVLAKYQQLADALAAVEVARAEAEQLIDELPSAAPSLPQQTS